ncbi:MAG: PQQ-dependent sugar dehydrogenase [Candidatus Flexifilum sp.]
MQLSKRSNSSAAAVTRPSSSRRTVYRAGLVTGIGLIALLMLVVMGLPTAAQIAPTATFAPIIQGPIAPGTPPPLLPLVVTATPTTAPVLAFQTNTPSPTPATNPPPFVSAPPTLTADDGWSCGDFPCADDLTGWLARISVPQGYAVTPAGRFPGQVIQIAYGLDDRLYATVLENGTRSGALYALDPDGTPQRLSETLISPAGLAQHPQTGDWYIAARQTPESGGVIWRIPAGGGPVQAVVSDLPCCFMTIDNQPAGLVFGWDGALYAGVGALTDHAEMPPRSARAFAEILPGEAGVLRIDVATGSWQVYADGIRYPIDLAAAPDGTLYALDSGLLTGLGDRLLRLEPGGFYGWPYWTGRGCGECPPPVRGRPRPDALTLPARSRPHGLTVYDGVQFPANQVGAIFIALWNNTPDGQRVIRVDPAALPPTLPTGASDLSAYQFEPFVLGLLRPADVAVAPDGSLVVADYIHGHIWRVRFTG